MQFGSKAAEFLFVMSANFAMLGFEIVKSLTDDIEFVDLGCD